MAAVQQPGLVVLVMLLLHAKQGQHKQQRCGRGLKLWCGQRCCACLASWVCSMSALYLLLLLLLAAACVLWCSATAASCQWKACWPLLPHARNWSF